MSTRLSFQTPQTTFHVVSHRAPTLLPLLRSPTQGKLLALLYLHPERRFTLTQLAQQLKVSVPTVMREANRLTEAGFLDEERIGNARLLRASSDSPAFRPLSDLLALTYGPLAVLSEALRPVEGIERAYIFGSWAARYHGEAGPVPHDVDVLVVGSASRAVLFDLSEATSRQLGREVNIHRVSLPAWEHDSEDPFLSSVRARPLVELDLADQDR